MNNPCVSDPQSSNKDRLTIEHEISSFKRRVLKYREVLNDEAVWLFLATLGCWSVTNGLLQLVALIFILIIFPKRVVKRIKDTMSFSEWVKNIEDDIAQTTLPEDWKKARLFELGELRKEEMSPFASVKSAWIYIVCTIFYFLTLGNWVYIELVPLISKALHVVPKN